MERTLCVIKPDACDSGRKVFGIISAFMSVGLVPVGMKVLTPTMEVLDDFYEGNKGKWYQDRNLGFMTTGPLRVIMFEGDDAIKVGRKLAGDTDPKEAGENTLRGRFGSVLPCNVLHVSDSKKEFMREISVLGIMEYEWVGL